MLTGVDSILSLETVNEHIHCTQMTMEISHYSLREKADIQAPAVRKVQVKAVD